MKGVNPEIIYKGEVITGVDTFLKRLVKSDDTFIILSGA